MQGSKDALSKLGAVSLETVHLQAKLKGEASSAINAIQAGINVNDWFKNLWSSKKKTDATAKNFSLSYQFGQLFAKGQSLASDEINSDSTRVKSGAEKIRMLSLQNSLI